MASVKLQVQKHLVRFLAWSKNFFWRRQAVYGFFILLLLAVIVVQLSIIPVKFAQTEIDYSVTNQSISAIAENPLSLPHKVATYSALTFSDNVRSVRAVSIIFFGLCILALYRVLKRWHSDKIALLATTLFATNAITLAVGRLASPLVLILGWSVVISLLLWLQHGNSRRVAPFVLIVISAGLLYVPGAPYFFILLLLLFGNKIMSTIKSLKPTTFYVAVAVSIFVITPLILSFIQDTSLIRQWLLLPPVIDVSAIPKNILRVPSAFIFRAPIDPLLNVGRLPILDVAAGGFFLVGLYAYQKNIKLERTRIMLVTALFGIILGAFGELIIAIVLLLPFVYGVIAAGISYILDEWYSVFPKNPFARSFGLLVVITVVLMSSYYQLTRFLVVWPQTPETRSIYSQSGLVQ